MLLRPLTPSRESPGFNAFIFRRRNGGATGTPAGTLERHPTMTEDEVFEKVRTVLEDALGVDEDEVTPQATLVGDLGAESIDFLDIVFRLEKSFDIKVDQAELFPDNVLNDPTFVQDGKVTDEGMKTLTERLPHANLDTFAESRDVEDFPNVFTVESISKFVQARI
ncbi:MAG: acyl carrier protein [Algisphaera sp.]